MQVAGKITLSQWMTDPGTVSVMAALNEGAAEPQALFVGGCVRNELLGLPVGDVDIATRLTPQDVTERLEKAGIRVIPTGIDHGTVTAVTPNRSLEITTLRRDVETDGRHAVVAFTVKWREDAARRDFTINTLLADPQGNVYDPTGRGLADLEARRVVFVGEPSLRIEEDYLRILRFFRFFALYGGDRPDAGALVACRQAAAKIATLSRERITQEFLKILAADNAASILEIMFSNGILAELPGREYDAAILARLIELQLAYGEPEVVTRLAALAPEPRMLDKYLVLSNTQRKALEQIPAIAATLDEITPSAIRKLIYRYGSLMAGQALLLNAATRNAAVEFDLIKSWLPPEFPLSGDDVMAAGVPKGPRVGEILRQVEEWWLEQDMTPDRDACLKQIEELPN